MEQNNKILYVIFNETRCGYIGETDKNYEIDFPSLGKVLVSKNKCLPVWELNEPLSTPPKVKHYELWPGTEAIDIMKKSLTEEEFIGFLKGNILKYQLRKGNKPGEPLEKEQEKINKYKQILSKL